MNRNVLAIMVTLASMALHPTGAYAAHGWWGWLEEFSGPGSFRVRSPFQNIHFQFACTYDDILAVDPDLWNAAFRRWALPAPPPPPPAAPGAEPLALQPTPSEVFMNLQDLWLRERELLLPPVPADPDSFQPPAVLKQPDEFVVRRPFLTLTEEPLRRAFGTPFPPGQELPIMDPTALRALNDLNDRQRERQRRLKGCWFVDATRYIAYEDVTRSFPTIRAHGVDVGRTYFVVGPFDMAAALGFLQFAPDGRDVVRRFTLTPLRFHVRPLWFVDPNKAPDALKWVARLAYIPKLYVKQTAVVGTISGGEFGAPPPAEGEQEFRTTGELVTSYGVVFDLGEVIGWFAHR